MQSGRGKLTMAATVVAFAVMGIGLTDRLDGGEGESEKPPGHLEGLRKISPNRVMLSARMVTFCVASSVIAGPHAKGAILVYANDVALDYRRANPKKHDYPIGSVFLKEKYRDLKVTEPHLATVMNRVGESGAIDDWEFSVKSLSDGKQSGLSRNEAAACIDCHSGFKAFGFVSRNTEREVLKFLSEPAGKSAARRSNVDSGGFLELAAEAEQLRERRLLPAEDFARLAKRGDTLVLDARSRAAFARQHVAGAVNLPYTEFNPDALAEVIPSKNRAVLIYCDNNIDYPAPPKTAGSDLSGGTIKIGGGFKGPAAALNIPTVITLYGYGYRNLYELGPSVVPGDSVISFTKLVSPVTIIRTIKPSLVVPGNSVVESGDPGFTLIPAGQDDVGFILIPAPEGVQPQSAISWPAAEKR